MDSLKKITLIIFSSFFFLVMPLQAAQQPGVISGGVAYEYPDWFKESFLEIAEDAAEAGEEGKHVLLFFHLNGCPYCDKMLRDNFDQQPMKSQIQQNFDSISLNIKGDREVAMTEDLTTTERQLSDHLKVQYTPTIIFLNADNKTVLRLNGYRSPAAMQQALNYVQNKAYLKTSFSEYKRNNMKYGKYTFIDDPLISSTNDFSKLQGPVALLMEDNDCNECADFHNKMMKRPEIRELFGKQLKLVRLDAKSTQSITDFSGKKTTPLKLASELNLNYRPGIVLFDEGKEVARVDSLLYPFHFQHVLRMALNKNHQKYPGYLDLMRVRQEEMLAKGININIGKPADW